MDHPFVIGQVYKNRNGAYEVVLLNDRRQTMHIRYLESGEEAEVSIPLQARIWRNMAWEEQDETRRQSEEDLRHQRGYGEEFAGLTSSDFKTTVEGTTWRSRRGLAGRVARLLSDASLEPPYTFLTWAIYRWPVAFLAHREYYEMASQAQGVLRAKFKIELDEQYAYYGLYIERGTPYLGRDWDWLRLHRALRSDPQLLGLIETLEREHQVRFLGRVAEGEGSYHFADGPARGARPLWDEADPQALSPHERLLRIEALTPEQWLDCYLIALTPKADALQQGVRFAHTIADVMKAMLPLYTAAV